MKVRPLHDRILVRRLDAETKTAGGIIIPDTAKEKPAQAEIVAVGTGVRDEHGKLTPLAVKEGDIVKVKLVGFDDRGKVKLSMRAVDQDTGEDLEAKGKPEKENAA